MVVLMVISALHPKELQDLMVLNALHTAQPNVMLIICFVLLDMMAMDVKCQDPVCH